VAADRNALPQLTQAVLIENFLQFGLANQDNLQQLTAAGLEIGQQANLFEGFGGEVLRLIDNQDRPNTVCILLNEKIVEIPLQGHLVPAMDIQTEFFIDRRQQLIAAEAGIEDHGQYRIPGQAGNEILEDGGLA
jgi:hypothetical protein